MTLLLAQLCVFYAVDLKMLARHLALAIHQLAIIRSLTVQERPGHIHIRLTFDQGLYKSSNKLQPVRSSSTQRTKLTGGSMCLSLNEGRD